MVITQVFTTCTLIVEFLCCTLDAPRNSRHGFGEFDEASRASSNSIDADLLDYMNAAQNGSCASAHASRSRTDTDLGSASSASLVAKIEATDAPSQWLFGPSGADVDGEATQTDAATNTCADNSAASFSPVSFICTANSEMGMSMSGVGLSSELGVGYSATAAAPDVKVSCNSLAATYVLYVIFVFSVVILTHTRNICLLVRVKCANEENRKLSRRVSTRAKLRPMARAAHHWHRWGTRTCCQ